MAQVTLQLTSVCGGGNHLEFTVSGAMVAKLKTELSALQGQITDDDIESFAKVLIRLSKVGRTVAQTKLLLTTGVTVTI